MNGLLNFAVIVLVILLAAASFYLWRFLKLSDPDLLEELEAEQELKAKKDKKEKKASKKWQSKPKEEKESTVLVNMPILSYKLPEQEWVNIELTKPHTTIGRGDNCDICIKHGTMSVKHAEIVMKTHRFKNEENGVKYFVLKNLSKENPVSFLNDADGEDDWRDIAGSVPLVKSQKNAFYLGLVEMRISFPAVVHKVSEDPDLSAFVKENKETPSAAEDKQPAQKQPVQKKETVAAEAGSTESDKMEQELLKAQRQVVRRSPRTGNRI